MCGHVGVAGKLTANDEKVFKDLLYMDQLRGAHSTGIVQVDAQFDAHIVKEAIPAHVFLEWSPFKEVMRKVNNRVLIGHNRYATMGAHTSVNAHPFVHGEIYGAHNGTLKNQSLLPDSREFEVDSDNIYHSINKIGIQDTVSKLHGAYALVYWDNENETLNFVRNEERDLYFVHQDTNLYWASEKGMLMTALDRRKIKDYKIHQFQVDKLYTFQVTRGATAHLSKVEKPHVVGVTPYVVPKPVARTPRPIGKPVSSFTSRTAEGHTTVKKSVAEAVVKTGFGELSDIKWFFKEYSERSGVAIFESLDSASITLRVIGVKALRGRALGQSDNLYYEVLECLSVTRKNGKLKGVVAENAALVAKDWSHFIETDDCPSPTIADHTGKEITQAEYDNRYSSCSICSSVLFFQDREQHIYSHNEAVCGECNTEPQNQDLINYVRR